MNRGFLLFLLLLPVFGFSQTEFSMTKYNFGDLYENAPTYIDITIKNSSPKNVFILTIDKPQEVYYLYSSKTIRPDSSIVLRLKINDNIKGRFNYTVDVYLSDSNQPTTIYLSGNVKEKSVNSLTACPDFNQSPPKNAGPPEFDITIKVIDSLTREPIKKSKVFFVENGQLLGFLYTDNFGIIHRKMKSGYYYLTAEKSPYISNSYEGYINHQNNYIEIKLQKPEFVDPETIVQTPPNSENEIIINEVEEKREEFIPTTVGLLDPNEYKPNHLVFIADISTSMNQFGRLELLKLSLNELAKVLRPNDRLTLIAYSDQVDIKFENVSGHLKELIYNQVASLKIGGYTAGGDAIKEAYRLANKHFITEGNNQVFMVTDGAFNKGDKDYKKNVINNYEKKGIKFSVVGIKTNDFITTHMMDITSNGGGTFIRIMNMDDAQNKLIDEVKRNSQKN